MFKQLKFLSLALLLGVIVFNPLSAQADGFNVKESYRGVVKINTYYEDGENGLAVAKTTSGVVLDSAGLVLTNREAISVKNSFGSEVPVAFNVCLTKENPFQPPACNYSADLIWQNAGLDLALIKINNFSGVFPDSGHVSVAQQKPATGSNVYAYGYTAFGGDTLFGLVGKVAGVAERSGQTWIKSDILASFSPGAALINSSGELIGLVTSSSRGNQEALLINSSDIFVSQPLVANAQTLVLRNKLSNYLKNLIGLKSGSKYANAKPSIELYWGTDWKLVTQDANGLGLYVSQATPFETSNSNLNFPLEWVAEQVKPFHHSALLDKVDGFVDSLWNYSQGPRSAVKTSYDKSYNRTELKKVVLESLDSIEFNPNSWDTIVKISDLEVVSPIKDDVGFLNLSWRSTVSSVDDKVLDEAKSKLIQGLDCSDSGQADISIKTGRLLKCSMSGDEVQVVLFGVDNYLTAAVYGYGKNSAVTKQAVDNLIRSIVVAEQTKKITEQPANTDSQANNNQTEGVKNSEVSNNSSSSNQAQKVEAEKKSILNIGRKFMGRIMLQVEKRGEAWYLSPKTNQAHYLKDGAAAYQLMREQGLGIANKDLAKMPVALSDVSGGDTDNDGLADPLEQALGTDVNSSDSDNDNISDKIEIENGTDPLKAGAVKSSYNTTLVNKLKGKILLQVENRGEAWYVNPVDGKRYFLGQAEDAYQIMRNLGLGVAEKDFGKL